ncbi:hypothetical protein [Sphingomonas montana]|uniref:hypothetical protein n=1 Tax=Sphingomonas montana TaxID=1843236 RepID=UPI0013EB2DFE|nr:hypothetical protein [Sphingomonas montana]
MTDPKTTPDTEPKPEDKDAMLEGGQADYGSAGQQAVEGVNGVKGEEKEDGK